jgi:hypothetical protein
MKIKKTFRKLTSLALTALLAMTIMPAEVMAAGGYGPYGPHDPEDTGFVGLDLGILALIVYSLGMGLLIYSQSFKKKIAKTLKDLQ